MGKFCIEDSDFGINIKKTFCQLKEDQKLFDVTLVTDDGHHIQAHKIILSAGSIFFSNIFMKSKQQQNPVELIVYMKGIKNAELGYITEFLYNGEISILEENLEHFLETSRDLGIKGLKKEIHDDIHEKRDFGCKDNVTFDCGKEPKNGADIEITSAGNINLLDANSLLNAYAENDSTNITEDTNLVKTETLDVPLNTTEELDRKIDQIINKKGSDWMCNVCGKTTTKKQHIQYHAETHLEGVTHRCPLCGKSISTRKYLKQHISNLHGELYTCDFCGKSEMSRNTKYKHKCPKQG